MNINKEAAAYVVIGVLVGGLLTLIVTATAVNNHNNGMMEMMGMHTDGNNHSMNMNDNNMNNGR